MATIELNKQEDTVSIVLSSDATGKAQIHSHKGRTDKLREIACSAEAYDYEDEWLL